MKTVTQVALANDKANRTRSRLIVISVILTTMLLTIIAVWGNGIVRNNRVNADKMSGSYYGRYKGVTNEQIREMERHSEFSDIGKMAVAGEVDSRKKLSLLAADKITQRLSNLDTQLQNGSYPKAENEIAAQPGFFQSLGYQDVKVGDKISLKSRIDLASRYEKEDFVISGILKESKYQTKSYAGYVAEAYYEKKLPKESRRYIVSFRLDETMDIHSDNAEEILKELAGKCGIDKKYVSVNWVYLMWALDPGTETIAGCVMIACIIIFFSVAVIYNIFQVGITQKIQEYGKLKAIGMTKRQLKSLIQKEGMFLAVIGVPLGLLFGYIVSVFSFRFLMDKMRVVNAATAEMEKVSLFSFPMLLLAAFLAFFTVWVALKKPMRIVASVSTIEAIRYQETAKSKKGIRRGKESLNVRSLMGANMQQNRKRIVTTILTMGLSCVLFMVMANFVGNMDEEYDARQQVEYGQFQIELDYAMRDTAYPENNLVNILKDNPLKEETVKKIKEIDGVTDVKERKVFILEEKNHGPMTVSVLNREDFKRLKEDGAGRGILDYEEASKKDALLYGAVHFMEENGFSLGQKVETVLPNGNRWDTALLGSVGMADTDWIITEDTFQRLTLSGELNGYVFVDCKKQDFKSVQASLSELLDGTDHVEMNTYPDALDLSSFQMKTMKIGVYTFLIIIGIIGFMNLANTMITNVITRKQEFGILQAIGMTNGQLNRMLQWEGIAYTLGTLAVSLLIGIPLGYEAFVYGKAKGIVGLHVYHFPVMETVLLFAVLALMQLILSFLLSRNVKKDSLVERIRYQG